MHLLYRNRFVKALPFQRRSLKTLLMLQKLFFLKMWCDSKRLNGPIIQYPCRNESSQVQFGSSDNVIKVLLSLSVFLTHHHHQQHFVSIHLPPHPPGLCVPEVTKEKQRYSLITAPLKMNTLTSLRTLWTAKNISLICHSTGLVIFFFSCFITTEHRKVGERGWYNSQSASFSISPHGLKERDLVQYRKKANIQFWLVFWVN